MRRLALVAALLWTGAAVAEPAARPQADEPYALVRTLHALQEEIAGGDLRAHAAQRNLVPHIAERLERAEPEVWLAERNARAAVAFVLSGGPPSLMRKLLTLDPKPRIDERLLRGALAYVEGNEAAAKAALADVDPKALGGGLGAQIALVKAAVAMRDDPAKAARLLGVARLLAPGTLVEEAALRREIAVEGQRKDFARFERLTAQYLRRFRRSVYAGNLRERFGALLVEFDLETDPEAFGRVEALLARFDPEARRELLLGLSRHALVHGRSEAARRAAARAAELSPGGSPDFERAQFYGAAALVSTAHAEDGAGGLLALDPARLPRADQRLFEAVAELAIQVVEPMALPAGPVLVPAAQADDGGPLLAGTRTLRRGEALLSEVDRLLERSRQ